MPILSQLICKWHIKNTDIRKKVLTGYEETKEEMYHNSLEAEKKYHEKHLEEHNYFLKQ